MTKLLIDAGTTWSKVLELFQDQEDLVNSSLNQYVHIINQYKFETDDKSFVDKDGNALNGRMFLFPSSLLAKTDILFDYATGHMIKNRVKSDGCYENEVISLAYGAKKILTDSENATIVDLGSRDIKWVKFKDGKYKDLDWNGNCGSVTGATVEMLCKFYNVDPVNIAVQKDRIPVICGVFAMEKIMDAIAFNTPAEVAVARYIHGIAYNTWSFARRPEKIYLSGGFCMNPCFIESLKFYCEVVPLGRFVLLEGLY